MNVVFSKTREQFPLNRNKILKNTVTDPVSIVLILILVGLAFSKPFRVHVFLNDLLLYQNVGLLLSVLTFGVLAVLYLYQYHHFTTYFYDLTDTHLVLKKGPVSPRELSVPLACITDVAVSQGFFDKIFGVYDVRISSVPAVDSSHIDGLGKEAADGLCALLLQKAQAKKPV